MIINLKKIIILNKSYNIGKSESVIKKMISINYRNDVYN